MSWHTMEKNHPCPCLPRTTLEIRLEKSSAKCPVPIGFYLPVTMRNAISCRQERLVETNKAELAHRKPQKLHNRYSSCERLAGKPHRFECLGASHDETSPFIAGIACDLDVAESFRRFLNLIQNDRRPQILEKQLRIPPDRSQCHHAIKGNAFAIRKCFCQHR